MWILAIWNDRQERDLANASVAATCMALCPVFLALLEPLLSGRTFNGKELLLAMLVVNLEPVYAVFLAAILLDEQRQLDAIFYLGVLTILGAVLAHSWWQRAPARTSS